MPHAIDVEDDGLLHLTVNGQTAPNPVDMWAFYWTLNSTIAGDKASFEEHEAAREKRNQVMSDFNLPFKDLSHMAAVRLCERIAARIMDVKKNADPATHCSNTPGQPGTTESTASPPT